MKYITMSAKEAERISVMEALEQKRMKQKGAAKVLSLSTRQVRRLLASYP